MIIQCPKCESKNTYEIGNGYGCRMCGKQWPREGGTPIIINKVFNERKKDMPEEIKKYPSGKSGICTNCRREVWIADKEGRCKVCSESVKGLDYSTPEYNAALAAVFERLNDPKNKRASASNKPSAKVKVSNLKAVAKKRIEKRFKDAGMPPANDFKIPVLGVNPMAADLQAVVNPAIKTLKTQRDYLLTYVGKIDRAIELLS